MLIHSASDLHQRRLKTRHSAKECGGVNDVPLNSRSQTPKKWNFRLRTFMWELQKILTHNFNTAPIMTKFLQGIFTIIGPSWVVQDGGRRPYWILYNATISVMKIITHSSMQIWYKDASGANYGVTTTARSFQKCSREDMDYYNFQLLLSHWAWLTSLVAWLSVGQPSSSSSSSSSSPSSSSSSSSN